MPPRKIGLILWKHEWKPVHGFPSYEISNSGDVRNIASGRVLTKSKTDTGHEFVQLYRGGQCYSRGILKLIDKHFGKSPF